MVSTSSWPSCCRSLRPRRQTRNAAAIEDAAVTAAADNNGVAVYVFILFF